jgi:hypothetical protein
MCGRGVRRGRVTGLGGGGARGRPDMAGTGAGRGLVEALFQGVADELGLVVQLQLDQGVLDVVLNRPGR